MKKVSLLFIPMVIAASSFVTSCAEKCKVTFETSGGSKIKTVEVSKGSYLNRPVNPTKDGYIMSGWYKDPELEYKFSFRDDEVPEMVEKDMVLYAKWSDATFKINYILNGGTQAEENVDTFSVNENVTLYDPDHANCKFGGWYLDNRFTGDPVTGWRAGDFLRNVTLYAKWVATVTFETDGGTEIEPKEVVVGTKVSKPINPPIKDKYVFAVWVTDTGSEYDFDTIVEGDFTLYATYRDAEHTITFITEYGEIPPAIVKDGEKLVRPTDPAKENYAIFGWFLDRGYKREYNFASPVYEDLELYAMWKRVTCSIDVDQEKTDHLIFETMEGGDITKAKADVNKPFSFKVKAINDENGDYYYIPKTLNISVGGVALVEGYTITPDQEVPYSDYPNSATVTIEQGKLVDDIVISGAASMMNYYTYDIQYLLGLKCTAEPAGGGVEIDTPLNITFEVDTDDPYYEKSISLPKCETIFVQIDGQDWINPTPSTQLVSNDEPTIVYNENTGVLTVTPNKGIKQGINIISLAYNYPYLKILDWNTISLISNAGSAPYLFDVGDKRKVTLNGLEHDVQIIDFAHDELANSTAEDPKTAGITFEFANLVTNQRDGAVNYEWDGSSNRDFPNSNLNRSLNGTSKGIEGSVLDELPDDLQAVIKDVNKIVYTCKSGSTFNPTTYHTKLFPLSLTEYEKSSSGEGKIYKYYENGWSRKKLPVKGKTDRIEYWTRTPHLGMANYAYMLGEITTGANPVSDGEKIAPGFCV